MHPKVIHVMNLLISSLYYHIAPTLTNYNTTQQAPPRLLKWFPSKTGLGFCEANCIFEHATCLIWRPSSLVSKVVQGSVNRRDCNHQKTTTYELDTEVLINFN